MSRKGTANSKFGHLFGDSDSSSASTRESRLSGSGGTGDLYKDPLAAFIPPITATTATTRGGSSTAKATLSPPPPSSTTASTRGGSPPTSGPNSRSSSRAQNHALFSSLTGSGGGGGGSDSGSISGGSLFDSTPTPTLSAAKRDLLFGDGASAISSSRRTSTPPLSRNSNTTTTQQSSTRIPTPPMGGSLSRGNNTTLLDADSSPLGGPLGDFGVSKSKQQDEQQDVLSPLSTAPLARTNSQASTKSHESALSSRSARSQDVSAGDSSATLRSGINTQPASSVAGAAGAAGAAGSAVKEASPLIPSSSSTSSSTSSLARRAVTRTSVDHSQRQTTTTTAAAEITSPVISDPIFNPLTAPANSQLPPPPRHSSDWGAPQSIPSTTSSQSIETFQSMSRTSSPAPTATTAPSRPLVLSKNGFERDHLESFETPSSSLSPSPLSKSMSIIIPADDDAAAAFASDNLYSAGPTSIAASSSSILDVGFSHSRTSSSSITSAPLAGSSTVAGAAAIAAAASAIKPGVGIGGGTVGQPKTRSGFSLGEDVADSSNPWMNSLVDSMDSTKLSSSTTRRESTPNIVDYTQSEAASAAFSTPVLPPSLSSGTSLRRTVLTPIPPSLEDDVGGFEDMFAGLRSGRGSGATTPTPSLFPPTTTTSSKSSSQQQQNSTVATGASSTASTALSLSSWNVLDAVEAAAQDPDFLGASAIVNPSTAKVLAMMQMPKDALDKDISAQEVFDNPWE
ncbi:hypothetical protein BGZ95_001505 [Linnemannia exigua]|uniref:Uncharacterized protein n=1 Tax=Linnemannia exigua TaxID=604196 RepID=A0AAD4H4X7_9FUNG|nr:hypothetical protein BGZ95_001505 [Linnemannia exigua]